MKQEIIKPHIGNIVLVDLITGLQLVSRIIKVDENTTYLEMAYSFQMVTELPNPELAPSATNQPIQNLKAIPFGGPFAEPMKKDDEKPIDNSHILAIHVPFHQIKDMYLSVATGIEIPTPAEAAQITRPTPKY